MPRVMQEHPFLGLIPFVGLLYAVFGGLEDGDILR